MTVHRPAQTHGPIAGWEERAASLRDEAALRTTLALVIGRLEDFARQVQGRMAEVDWSLQRDLIRTLVKRVEIDRDGVNVVFRVAPSPSDPRPPDPGGKRTLQGCGWSGDTPAEVSTEWTVDTRVDTSCRPRTGRRCRTRRCSRPVSISG